MTSLDSEDPCALRKLGLNEEDNEPLETSSHFHVSEHVSTNTSHNTDSAKQGEHWLAWIGDRNPNSVASLHTIRLPLLPF